MKKFRRVLKKKNRDDIQYVLLVIAYRALLDWTFVHVITQQYRYANFQCDPSVGLMILSWLLLAVFAFMMRKPYSKINTLSDEILFLFFIFSVVPFSSMVGLGQFEMDFIFWAAVYWLMLFVAHRLIKGKWKRELLLTKKRFKHLDKLLDGITIFFFLLVIYVSGRYAGFRLNFSIASDIIYEYRMEARANGLPSYFRYPLAWSQAIMPILIAYYIKEKRPVMIAVIVMANLMNFGYDGQKTPFFMMLLAISINIVRGINYQTVNKWVLPGITAILFLGIIESLVLHSYYIDGVLIRRILFLPNLVSSYYFDFFKTHVPDYLRSGMLSALFGGGPYPGLPYTIGELYVRGNHYMNNGLIGEAVANFGRPGILLMPWLVVLTLRILDRCSAGIDIRIYLATAVSIAFTLINSYLSVTLVTHGLIVLMLLLTIMKPPKDGKRVYAKKNSL